MLKIRTLILVILVMGFCGCQRNQSTFEMRFADSAQRPGVAYWQEMEIPENGATVKLWIDDVVQFDASSLASAYYLEDDARLKEAFSAFKERNPNSTMTEAEFAAAQEAMGELVVRSKADAAARLQEVTASNLNRRLVILVGGKPVMAPVIREPIAGNEIVSFSKDQAIEMASAIKKSIS